MTNWRATASDVRWDIRPFIGGEYGSSESDEHYENIDPASEEPLCLAPSGSPADVDAAVRAARDNVSSWSRTPPARRLDVLMRLADLMVEHSTELALLDSLEMGKPISASLHDAGSLGPSLLRSWAGFADKLYGASAPLTPGNLSFNVYEPRGVIGAITPWNFPTVVTVFKLGPALAAGNAVVLKPSELSPSSALKLAELAVEAGLPAGVLNVVPGLGKTVGAALALHPDVDLLSFTGSTATGHKIMELSGRSGGKPLLLECGGKSPQVVFGDADDLDNVADAAVQSFLWNQGQVCSAHTRLIVQDDIKDALLEKIVVRARGYEPGDPLDETTTFGPLASPDQRDRVRTYIDAGLKAGADAVLRGAVREAGGCFVSPTIFDQVHPDMSIAREEIFGPVLCVQSFETEEEAIALANGTEFGLSATVWTRDLGRGMRLAHAIRAGKVSVRTSGPAGPDSGCVLSNEPQKASGFGSEMGIRGLQSYSTLKLVGFHGA